MLKGKEKTAFDVAAMLWIAPRMQKYGREDIGVALAGLVYTLLNDKVPLRTWVTETMDGVISIAADDQPPGTEPRIEKVF